MGIWIILFISSVIQYPLFLGFIISFSSLDFTVLMVGRDGGKQKPLKQAKKGEKVVLEEDIEFKKKMVCDTFYFRYKPYRLRRRRKLLPPQKHFRRNK